MGHKKHENFSKDMESYVNKLTTLFNKSKVGTIILNFPLLLLNKVVASNSLIFDFKIIGQIVVEIVLILDVVILFKLVLSLC